MTSHTPEFVWPVHSDQLPIKLAQEAMQHERWERALTFLKMALDQPSQIHGEMVAMVHNNLGILYRFIGLNNLAMGNFQIALDLAGQQNAALSGIINYNAALLLFDESRWSEARDYVTSSVQQLEKAGSEAELIRSLELSRDITASANFTHNLLQEYAESVTPPDLQAHRLREVARIYVEKGFYQEAIQSLNQAVGLCKSAGLHSLEAIILNDLAILYQDADQSDAALQAFNNALELAISSGNRLTEASIRNNLGLLNKSQNKLGDALEMFEMALAIKLKSSQPLKVGTILYNLAATHLRMDHQEEALVYAQRALEADRVNEPSRVEQDLELISQIESTHVK